jgi:molybdate transport system permease protein
VLAVTFVASPFYVRTAIAAFEAVDADLVSASRTLGAGPGRTFARVALPLASGGLGAGAALAFARGLGEFGATIMFAGSLQGVTQTLSLAVYQEFDVAFDTALAIGALLVVASALVLLAAKVVLAWRRSTSTSITVSAPSVSS